MHIQKIEKGHLQDVIELFKYAYLKENSDVDILPAYKEIEPMVIKAINTLFEKHQGIVVIKDGKIVGYMFYILTDEMFGHSKGAFIPLTAHASIDNNRYEIYQLMLNQVSQEWINKHRLSWVVSMFEHDEVLSRFWFNNGFGNRCFDAISAIHHIEKVNKSVVVKKADMSLLPDIKSLHESHNRYYKKAPTCMPSDDKNVYDELVSWFKKPKRHLWIAYIGHQAVGYMRIEENGESLISTVDSMMNVSSAYTDPNYRGMGVGRALLQSIHQELSNQPEIKILGVDSESINPHAYRFWMKHFIPYTKSVHRRIDEGVLE